MQQKYIPSSEVAQTIIDEAEKLALPIPKRFEWIGDLERFVQEIESIRGTRLEIPTLLTRDIHRSVNAITASPERRRRGSGTEEERFIKAINAIIRSGEIPDEVNVPWVGEILQDVHTKNLGEEFLDFIRRILRDRTKQKALFAFIPLYVRPSDTVESLAQRFRTCSTQKLMKKATNRTPPQEQI